MGTYVISFESTHAAMRGSKALEKAGIKFATIPLPTAISAGCGMAALFDSDDPFAVFETATASSKDPDSASLYEKLGKREYSKLYPR